jgi:hypothetical protein
MLALTLPQVFRSLHGRPKGECRSALRGGCLMSRARLL